MKHSSHRTVVLILLLPCSLLANEKDFQSRARDLVAQMTLEEKASLTSGRDFWSTKPIDRLGIPSIFMTDGPHGLRKATGANFLDSVFATCFPTASALASSWNVDLLRDIGTALGKESQTNDVQILLGSGVNMKRSPLGGRNFEYMPSSPGRTDAHIVAAVRSREIKEARLDEVVTDLLTVFLHAHATRKPDTSYDQRAHHELTRHAATESIVLLKNDNLLPLDLTQNRRIAVIGRAEIRGHYVILDICTGGGFSSRPWCANFGSRRREGFTT